MEEIIYKKMLMESYLKCDNDDNGNIEETFDPDFEKEDELDIDINIGNPNIKDDYISYLKRQGDDQILFKFILKINNKEETVLGSYLKDRKEIIVYGDKNFISKELISNVYKKLRLSSDLVSKVTVLDKNTIPLKNK